MTDSGNDNLKQAISYLEGLQRKSARGTLSEEEQALFDEEMVREFMANLGETESEARARIEKIRRTRETMFSRYENPIWMTHAAELIERIESVLPRDQGSTGKRILFGTLGTGDVNGMALDFKNPEYHIIVLDDGVFGFVNLLSKAIVHTFPLIDEDKDEPVFSTDLAAIKTKIAAEPMLFVRFADFILNYVVSGDPFVADRYYPSRPYLPPTAAWLDSMECFILGHEYGHSRRGHLETGGAALISHGTFNEVAVSWQQEFEADAFGLAVTLACAKNSSLDPAFHYAGIECFFAGLGLVMRVLSRFAEVPFVDAGSDSHPPLHQRRAALRKALETHLDEAECRRAIRLAMLVDEIIATMWPWLEEEIVKLMDAGRKPDPKWTA